MNQSFTTRNSAKSAFTLVELLVSVSIISLILVILVGMTNQISQTWRSTTGKIEQFQEAREGFESMTRKIGQATLNTYYDMYYVNVGGRLAPKDFLRQSQLRFVSGPMSKLAPDPDKPTHGIFFQAPLGFVEDQGKLGHLENLLNTWGYFIEAADDTNTRPPFLTGLVPTRWRSRLMELMQPTENLSVYDLDQKGEASPVSGDQLGWFRKAITGSQRPVRPIAENIVALIIWPKLSKQEEDKRRDGGKSVLAPNYVYDSSLLTFKSSRFGTAQAPVFLNEGARMNGGDLEGAAQINPKNQLPPVVQVTMVALDELSAARLEETSGKSASLDLVRGLFEIACPDGTRANAETQFETDLKTLEERLVEAKLTYRVLTTNVIIRGAKWSAAQTK